MGNILIFSASTGGGHNQVAAVLEREFVINGHQVETHDFLHESSRFLELLLADTYNHMATVTSPLFGLLYRTSNREKVYRGVHRLLFFFLSDHIQRIVQGCSPDLIVATHPMIVNVMGELKARGQIDVPILSVVTDFDAHQSYINRYVDAYITASDMAVRTLTNKGIPRGKIYINGIPVSRDFWQSSVKDSNCDKFTVLLMGGMMGSKPIAKTLDALLDVPYPLRIIVVCSNNRILKKKLDEKYRKSFDKKELIIYGFAPDISRLMDEADVIFTKPGGITTSEAIAKRIPMVIPFFIPGPEQQNTKILVEYGVALQVNGAKGIRGLVTELVQNPDILKQVVNNMRELSSSYSLEKTMLVANQLLEDYQMKRRKLHA